MTDEILVVLDRDAGSLTALGVAVGHTVSDQVGIVQADPPTRERLRAHPRVLAALRVGEVLPSEVARILDESERLFVDGWQTRHTQVKQRPGEGLPWDAPGHDPPDP